jgi:hypothetical protein
MAILWLILVFFILNKEHISEPWECCVLVV